MKVERASGAAAAAVMMTIARSHKAPGPVLCDNKYLVFSQLSAHRLPLNTTQTKLQQLTPPAPTQHCAAQRRAPIIQHQHLSKTREVATTYTHTAPHESSKSTMADSNASGAPRKRVKPNNQSPTGRQNVQVDASGDVPFTVAQKNLSVSTQRHFL